MVVSLGPGKFYGQTLPRPRIYTDVKFNDKRVDPRLPVMDPFISWSNEAHWSMGGLSFKRLRLNGRIEGNVNKLRREREKLIKKQNNGVIVGNRSDLHGSDGENVSGTKRAASISPPPAPFATKRRRFMALIDDDVEEKEGEEDSSGEVRRRLVKKLGGDFDRVASEVPNGNRSDNGNLNKIGNPLRSGSNAVAFRTRSRKLEEPNDVDEVLKVVEEVIKLNSKGKKLKAVKKSKSQCCQGEESPNSASRVRCSPRLPNHGLG
ncbi:Histone-lysine N-methyltransferase, H3 lysine-36 specific [Quillaja saponaria]|uniref:Histone-lysine N-methyltransferase, H3 lysine-36 specific n=1 Tax=Quillaja saponaria TaxID=32244 RepID=A0AAD7KYU8_QUISA|nr:Histone-lysine N-methyltransferase, H3 lysine-36 specific [Quillaja saponaria]